MRNPCPERFFRTRQASAQIKRFTRQINPFFRKRNERIWENALVHRMLPVNERFSPKEKIKKVLAICKKLRYNKSRVEEQNRLK